MTGARSVVGTSLISLLVAGLVASGCGGLDPDSSSDAKPEAFIADWVLSGGPIVSCPDGTPVSMGLDSFIVVASTDYPLKVRMLQGGNVCELDFGLSGQTATLGRSEDCTFDFDAGTATVNLEEGKLVASSDEQHLSIDLSGDVEINSASCTWDLSLTGTR